MYDKGFKLERTELNWLDDIHDLPNVFNTSTESKTDVSKMDFSIYADDGELIDTYSPEQRLLGEVMKRWHNNYVQFDPMYLNGLGVIRPNHIGVFSLFEKSNENHFSKYTSDITVSDIFDDGVADRQGSVTFNFHDMTLIITLESDDGVHDIYTYMIDRILPYKAYWLTDTKQYVISNRIVLNERSEFEPMTDDDDGHKDADTKHWLVDKMYGVTSDVSLDMILKGVVNKPDYEHTGLITINDNILPWYPENFTRISKLTGVSATTLSELRHGKKEMSRLSVNTAKLLTDYAYIRYIDSMMVYVRHSDNIQLVEVLFDGTSDVIVQKDRVVVQEDVEVIEMDEDEIDYAFDIILKNGVILPFEYKAWYQGFEILRKLRKSWVEYVSTKVSKRDGVKMNDDAGLDTPIHPYMFESNQGMVYIGDISAIKVRVDKRFNITRIGGWDYYHIYNGDYENLTESIGQQGSWSLTYPEKYIKTIRKTVESMMRDHVISMIKLSNESNVSPDGHITMGFVLDLEDSAHETVLYYLMENRMLPENEDGTLKDISFKLDDDPDGSSLLHLSDFIDLDTREWLE